MSTSREGEEPQTRHFFICCCYFGSSRLALSGGGQGRDWGRREKGGSGIPAISLGLVVWRGKDC